MMARSTFPDRLGTCTQIIGLAPRGHSTQAQTGVSPRPFMIERCIDVTGPAAALGAVGGSRRRGVEIDLQSRELPIPERPHVCLIIDQRAVGVPYHSPGLPQRHHLVVLGDELSWPE